MEEEGEFGFGATDTRMAVMGIISFLPYFNWLVSEAQGFSAFALHFFFGFGFMEFSVLFGATRAGSLRG